MEAQKTSSWQSLWWLMHHSFSDKRQTIALSCYVDDSGSHEQSPLSVVGGPVFGIKGYGAFTLDWDQILSRHSIEPRIYQMTNVGRSFKTLNTRSGKTRYTASRQRFRTKTSTNSFRQTDFAICWALLP